MDLSIIIPAYNEEDRLPLTLQRVFEYLSVHYKGTYEVIVADDGSTDRTAEIVKNHSKQYPQISLLQFTKNRGRGAALRDAIFKTNGEFILETDADGSVNEHAVLDFLKYFSKHPEVDMLTGSRTVEGSRILTPQSLLRKVFGYGFFFLAKIMFGWKFMDRINGFKMFRRETALDIFNHQYENSFFGEAEIVYIAETRGWKIRELPILWTDYKGSKVKPLKESWRSLLGMFRVLIRNRKGLYAKDIKKISNIHLQQNISKKHKNVLITGGCGFIGSNFIHLFYHNHLDTNIINLDLLTYAGDNDNLKDIETEETKNENKRYFFVHGDICDESFVENLFSEFNFDLVIHFAAESHVDRSIYSSVDFIRTNVEGTRVLIDASRKHHTKRFVHISTDEIYGSYEKGYANEDWAIKPSNPYSASKAGADVLVQSYIKTHDFPAIIIRGSNNYGPYQYPEKLIPLAITNLLEGAKIPIHGYGTQIRSWLHVKDFCRAIDMIIQGKAKYNIYNVAGEEKSILDVLKAIAVHFRKDLSSNCFNVNDRPGADFRYAVSSKRLIDDFGWKTEQTFENNLKNTIQWYVDNTEWWKNKKLKNSFKEHYERQSKGQWA